MKTLSKFVPYMGFGATGDFGPLTVYTSKQRKRIAFLKEPPLVPATLFQRRQRKRFTNVARIWRGLPQDQRLAWRLAAQRSGSYCTGYNLFVYWHLTLDRPTIQTIERISHQNLL